MSEVVIYRLAEWPAAKHLLPVLHMLGVPADALEVAFYFHASGTIVFTLPEVPRHPEAEPAMLHAAATLGSFGRKLVGVSEGGRITSGFHWSATVDELAENARANGHDVLRLDEVLRIAEGQRPTPDEDRDLEAFEILLKHCAAASDRSALRHFVVKGGALPSPRSGPLAAQTMTSAPGQWGPLQERILDALLKLAGSASLPELARGGMSPSRPNGQFPRFVRGASEALDDAGCFLEKLRSRGVSDELIFRGLTGRHSDRQPVIFGDAAWESRWLLLLGWYARFADIATFGEGAFARLFCAPVPDHYRPLIDLCLRHQIERGFLREIDLPSLRQLRLAAKSGSQAAFGDQAREAFAGRVLGSSSPSLASLNALAEEGLTTLSPSLQATLLLRAREAAARVVSLADLELALGLHLITQAAHDGHVVSAFQRAVASGFYGSGERAEYGDAEGFVRTAPTVARTHPDLVLQAVICMTERYNEHGIREGLPTWEKVVPQNGFSPEVLEQVSVHFGKAEMRAAASLMKRFLAARGVAPAVVPLPRIEDIDVTQHVGTDVGHLAIGSFAALDRLGQAEDPADWPKLVKKMKCVAFETIGDGSYSVRVVHVCRWTPPPEGVRLIAVFPLQVKDETLGVSGIVGGGGVPTIPFPNGTYAAELFQHASITDFSVVLTQVERLPRRHFGEALPRAGDAADSAFFKPA